MVAKRKRRASPSAKGLDPGVRLNRSRLPGSVFSAWGWVGAEVKEVSDITQDHLLATCGFSKRSTHPFCINKYVSPPPRQASGGDAKAGSTMGELEDDVIVISEDEGPPCNKKICKSNPNCLNYLGQDAWEDEDASQESFIKALKLGDNPLLEAKDPDLPVGLKNLGATCYANAFLQVWFQDLAFRSGVYRCQPAQDMEQAFEESPIFQLQVTFTALQESAQNVFNPIKLVESLKLCTTEQQDAQEFSKLFMSHLDLEFQKQPALNLRSLLADQFQGKQVYGTICETCRHRSETLTDFLELEINFQRDADLEGRIEGLLQPETLSGDNKYLCARCNSLQDATRYTELRELPPVLHFSLLRFVYDVTSMERKKSNHTISFPKSLDMGKFLQNAAGGKMAASQECDNANIYELRGVLLHKGPSAYHGHYEAQVFDVMTQAWFQFNDEEVTKIKVQSLGDERREKSMAQRDVGDTDDSAANRKKRLKTKVNRRIDDNDEDAVETAPSTEAVQRSRSGTISSRDAYMLIYARKSTHFPSESTHQQEPLTRPEPPPRALEVIKQLNAAHDEACKVYAGLEKQAKVNFADIRRKVMDIYRSWNVSSPNEASVVVSRDALETWLSIPGVAHALKQREEARAKFNGGFLRAEFESDSLPAVQIPSATACIHGPIDPQKASSLKRITQIAYRRIMVDTNCEFTPALTPEEICEICVKEQFMEKLYQIQHPQVVQEFEASSDFEVEDGYWISKPWLKDWKLMKPKMHVPCQNDPAPDSDEFRHHVRCDHGNLALTVITRRRISVKAAEVLKTLFPSWQPLSTDAELCPICDCMIHMSKGERLELRKKAENEKARLRNMHEHALNGHVALLEPVPRAVVPAQFVRSWRQWLARPNEAARPETVDNSSFLCEHGMLIFDPNNPLELDSSVAIITRSDWDTLEELYSGGPLIALENHPVGDKSHQFMHDIPICSPCRHQRRSEYQVAEINVRILSSGSTLADAGQSVTAKPLIGPASSIRQSKRLRKVRAHGERRKLTITKLTTVKDIKVALQRELGISTICQRLYYQGVELKDSSATVQSVGILANDLIDLREEDECEEKLHSDVEVAHVKSSLREGNGFGGTLLMGGKSQGESSGTSNLRISYEPGPPNVDVKICTMCTYHNRLCVEDCEMCQTHLQ